MSIAYQLTDEETEFLRLFVPSDGARRASPYIMVARARQGMGAKMGEEPV